MLAGGGWAKPLEGGGILLSGGGGALNGAGCAGGTGA